MARTGSTAHVVPMNAVIHTAPKETRVLAGIHREEDCVAIAEGARNGLRCEVLRRRIEQRQAHGPGSAVVGRNGHFEWQLVRHSTAATEKAQCVPIAPKQSGLIVERFEIAE